MNNTTTTTTGTWVVIACNVIIAIVGVLQAVDWIHVVGGQTAGLIAAGLSALNVIAHYYTGPPATPPSNTTPPNAQGRY